MSLLTQRRLGKSLLALAGAIALAMATAVSASGAPIAADNLAFKVAPQVRQELSANGSTSFFVYLRAHADVSGALRLTSNAQRRTHVFAELTATADRSQAGLRKLLDARGVSFDSYWIANAIRVTGDEALLRAITALSDVWKVEPDRTYQVITPVAANATDQPGASAVEWGVANINADDVWSEFGVRGEGVVIANIDTGVRYDHAALVNQYRGNIGDGTFDHNYNWYDPAGVCSSPAPCDNNNHGTHTMGTMVGDDGGSNQIGVAPGATWIAAKGCESGSCSSNSLLRSGEWVIAPTDLAGNNPRPELGADVVNNSWGGGQADTWYQQTMRNWIAAGTFPAFANGNSGPGCGSANSPGDNPEAYAVGAYDSGNNIANFSSRGASQLDGAIKPNIAAPGVNVRSAVAGGGYSSFSGTSMATPHVAGAVALVWSASEESKGDIDATRSILDQTAIDVNSTGCGGTAEYNNNFGQGRLDALAAVNAAPRGPTGTLTGTVTDAATGSAIAGATVTASGERDTTARTDSNGVYTMKLSPGSYPVTADHGDYEPASAEVSIVENETTKQDFALQPKPRGALTGTVTDAVTGSPVAGASIVASGDGSGQASTDENGDYTLTLAVGTYSVTASMSGYKSQTATDVVITDGGTTTQDFVLTPSTGNLAGQVTRASNGTPVSGASVYLFNDDLLYNTTTGSDGRYVLSGVEEGSYSLYVWGGGCYLSSTTVMIVAGETTVKDVALNCWS